MEPLASQSSIKLVVKTPNQRVKDIEVDCLLHWTVEKLKSHLSTVYPTKPARSIQKIIYSGKLLDDHFVLKDILKENEDGNHQTVHLVCTPATSEQSNSQMTAPVSTSSQSSSMPQVTSTPSPTTTMQDTSQPDGLRHRTQPYAQHPFYNMQFGNTHHFPHVAQMNANGNMAGQIPSFGFPNMYPNAHFTAQNIHYAAQQMAHMHWMQHMAQMMQGNFQNIHGNIPTQQNIVQQNIGQPAPQVNQPAAAAAEPPVRQAQERRENQGENMVMNANAGGGMMQDDEDEENRDWLDYVYMAVRISMLMSIFWFYSSAERLIIMGLVIFIVWLVQSGVFHPIRAPGNRQEVPVNEDNDNAETPRHGDEQGTEEDIEVIEGDSESESESLGEDQTDNTNNNHPGYFVVGYNFFVTFFTSLIPQPPRPIGQP